MWKRLRGVLLLPFGRSQVMPLRVETALSIHTRPSTVAVNMECVGQDIRDRNSDSSTR